MSAASLPALRRHFTLFAVAFVAATVAFGTIMLTSPPTSEAAVTEAGRIPGVTICEYLPTGDIATWTVQN
jgi:hypothetical protein